jgi:hypothetical protein
MNHYALTIRDRWAAMAPNSFAAIPDPDQFFGDLGETTLITVQRLTAQLSATPAKTDYLEQVGTLNAAKKQAEEIALSEVPWPALEMSPDETRDEWESTRPQESGLAEWMISLDRPLMEHELAELSEKWLLSTSFLQEMADSENPTTYLDSHSEALLTSQQLRFTRDLQNQ